MRKSFGASVVALSVLVSSGLFAEEAWTDPRSDVVMKEVVVTGTRFEERIERIPANITVIDEEDIRNSNARTVPDLLRSEEGIVVRDWTGNRKQVTVDLRGFGESAPSNVLVLVDGRRVNEIDLSGVDWTQIPIENVERIEILRGAGSVLYGDNAVGGVINIITRIPSQELAFSAGADFGSYGLHGERVSISGGQGRFMGALYGTYQSTNGYRENNDYRAKDAGGKILFDATDFLTLNFSGAYHSDNFGLPGYLTPAQLNLDRRGTQFPLDRGATDDTYLKGGFDLALGQSGSLVTDISYRKRETDTNWISFAFIQDSVTHTYALTPRYLWSGAILGRKNSLIAGVDLYRSDQATKSYTGAPPFPSGLADIERDSYGFYVHNEFYLLDRVLLSVGARRERVKYELHQRDLTGFLAPLDARITERENAYTAGLTWIYAENSSVFMRANRSLRFPLTDELVLFDFFAGAIRVNTDLMPQRGNHYEVGVKHRFTPWMEGSLTLFRADIKDEIFLNPLTFTNENHPETLHQGLELGIRAVLMKHLTAYGNYTYEKATFEEEPFKGNNVPAVPRHKGNLGFRIHDMIPGLVFSADYNYVGSSFLISDQSNQLDKLENYYTIDARLSYSRNQLRAFAGVNNLTDKKYSQYAVAGGGGTFGVFYPSPERNWVTGVEFVF